jgi:hypothetical protein
VSKARLGGCSAHVHNGARFVHEVRLAAAEETEVLGDADRVAYLVALVDDQPKIVVNELHTGLVPHADHRHTKRSKLLERLIERRELLGAARSIVSAKEEDARGLALDAKRGEGGHWELVACTERENAFGVNARCVLLEAVRRAHPQRDPFGVSTIEM